MDWCILRMAGGRTMSVVRSLSDAGFEVWSPVEIQRKRLPRSKAQVDRTVCVMPTYVFARASHLSDLVKLSLDPVSPHPDFSVFRYQDRFPLIADAELQSLRAVERQAAAKNAPMKLPRGTSVRLQDGPFQGLTGQVIEASKGQFTLVAFHDCTFPVKFSTWQLHPVDSDSLVKVEQGKPEQGNAAVAA